MFRWNRIWALIVKEFKVTLSNKSNRTMIIFPPLIQLVLFTYTATLEVKKVFIAVYDKDNTEISRSLTQKFDNTPIVERVYRVDNEKDMKKLMDAEKIFAVLTIPQNFSKNIYSNNPTSLQVIIDGRRSNASQIVSSYIGSIIQKFSAEMNESSKVKSQIEIKTRNIFNPNLNYQWFILVCLTGILAMNMAFMITALAIAQEKELGTFEQTIISPLKSSEILIGKTIPAILITLFDVTLLIIGSVILFRVPIEGSIIVLYLCIIIFLLSISGIGLSISTVCKTQQQSVLGLFIVTSPLMMLSGFMTPIENMPAFFQMLTKINPLTYFFVLLRGIFLKNISAITILENAIPMLLIGVVTLVFSWWFFNKNWD